MELIDETKTCRKLMDELKAPWENTKTLSMILEKDDDDTIHQMIVDLIKIVSDMLPEIEKVQNTVMESQQMIDKMKIEKDKIQMQQNNMHVLRTVFKTPK